jgi:hypothetical protein
MLRELRQHRASLAQQGAKAREYIRKAGGRP